MQNQEVQNFLDACDELINCKFLVAEYKITKLLQNIAGSSDICSLISECLQSYNRDREFARTYIQDGHGEFVCVMPTEEYKVVALVFCTLADIDNKKIDFTDFIKRFFGNSENPYQAFIETMIIPFKSLISEAFVAGYNEKENKEDEKEQIFENHEISEEVENFEQEDKFETSTKIAVQILSELEDLRESQLVADARNVATSMIKTANLRDEVILMALAASLRYMSKGLKSIKFLVRELCDVVFD